MFSSVATSQTHEIKMMFMMQEIGVLIFSIGKKTHTHTHIYIYIASELVFLYPTIQIYEAPILKKW
jgi:hypothetical protein